MSLAYEEVFEGEAIQRSAPGRRHEVVCARLHELIRASVADLHSTRLMPPRAQIQVTRLTALCPDLALLTSVSGKLWLAAEIVNSEDHRNDTVIKKQIYEDLKVPRLWMIDPRYDNVEVYHAMPYGLALKGIFAGHEVLTETLLPEFQLVVAELFAPEKNLS
ncbi:MAG: Uma2 family endonuclease [Verrucomicrobia bacterium]|nr:MAG: Uma2 family endonuclease [Verrucomicrobiota bacterium]